MLKSLAILTWFFLHPVHVTLTSIEQAPGTDSLKVFVKMYYDDFLVDYELFAGNGSLKDITPAKSFPGDRMNRYINEKVTIFINNKRLEGKLLNQYLSDNEIRINLIYKSEKRPEKITVKNTIMTSLYSDQANMTIIRINDFEEGFKLTPEITEQTISVN